MLSLKEEEMDFKELIKVRRKELGLTLEEVAKACNVTKATVMRWENGNIVNIKKDKIYPLAKILKLDPFSLLDFDQATEVLTDRINNNLNNISNIIPLPKTKKVPRLGKIACGEPILAEENYDDYDDVPEEIKCDFTLLCEGDSMINARIQDGDIVYLREQPQVKNGEIAACLVDGEFETKATLKRFYKYDDKIILQAENPKYQPFVYVNEEMNKVRIIGKAVGFTSRL